MFPQKEPRITAYMEVIISPGSKIMKISRQRSSENKNPKAFRPKNRIIAIGIVTARVHKMPAVTAECFPRVSLTAPLFAMRRDTVTGIPLEAAVKNTAKTVRQIW